MRCHWLIPTFLVLLLTGCSLLPDQEDETANWTASQFYYEAKENLDEGDYEEAIRLYETLMARYPFGRFAQQADPLGADAPLGQPLLPAVGGGRGIRRQALVLAARVVGVDPGLEVVRL